MGRGEGVRGGEGGQEGLERDAFIQRISWHEVKLSAALVTEVVAVEPLQEGIVVAIELQTCNSREGGENSSEDESGGVEGGGGGRAESARGERGGRCWGFAIAVWARAYGT